jgi:hypothetical protein
MITLRSFGKNSLNLPRAKGKVGNGEHSFSRESAALSARHYAVADLNVTIDRLTFEPDAPDDKASVALDDVHGRKQRLSLNPAGIN